MLLLSNTEKLCHCACLKHLMVVIRHRTANSEAGARIGRAGRQREQGEEDMWSQPHSHTTSHRVRVKVRYTEVRKGKSPEAKGSCG